MKICIIGGGASAMAAAIAAKRRNEAAEIVIIEKKEKLGAKLFATGNGRCNITNTECPRAMETALFFDSIGVLLREEREGRMYPASEKAADVVRALERQLEIYKVRVLTGCTVTEASAEAQGFSVVYAGENGGVKTERADRLLIASGGKAGPQYGTSGDGYRLAKGFGHTVNRLSPVLTPLYSADVAASCKGARAKARVTLLRTENGTAVPLAMENGEVQFTAKGLSGVCIFNLSRFVKLSDGAGFDSYSVAVDFIPDCDADFVENLLTARAEMPEMTAEDVLRSIVESSIGNDVLASLGIDKALPAAELGSGGIARIASELKDRRFVLSGAGGWRDAQCTAGGVELSEIDGSTMESRLQGGLYFAGEILDYDGACGGFNLQHAWETGIKAGLAMADRAGENTGA